MLITLYLLLGKTHVSCMSCPMYSHFTSWLIIPCEILSCQPLCLERSFSPFLLPSLSSKCLKHPFAHLTSKSSHKVFNKPCQIKTSPWPHGPLVTWPFARMAFCSHGLLVAWALGCMVLGRIALFRGYLDTLTCLTKALVV